MSKPVISYNGKNLFPESDPHPVPFVSKTVEYVQAGERLCQLENWTLNGVLIGCSFEELNAARIKLVNDLNPCFGIMNIEGFDQPLNPIQIQSIQFDDAIYLNSIRYTINFTYYPENSFNIIFQNIIQPSDSITYTENEDQSFSISREISAIGILRDSSDKDDAIDNAKSYIETRKNIPIPNAILIKNKVNENQELKYFLVSSNENVNRISNQVTLTQQWKGSLAEVQSYAVVHNYTISETRSKTDKTIISYQGKIEVGREGDISNARKTYNNFKSNGRTLLSESYTEDMYVNSIEYNFSYYKNPDDDEPPIEERYTISFSDESSSSLASASIQAEIIPYNCDSDPSAYVDSVKSKNFNFDIIDELSEKFKELVKCGNLNPVCKNSTINKQPEDRSASYNASFDTREILPELDTSYSISHEGSLSFEKNWGIEIKNITEGVDGYICQDLQIHTRSSVGCSISQRGLVAQNLSSFPRSKILKYLSGGSKIRDESDSFSINEDEKSASASCSMSYYKALDVYKLE